MMAIDTTRLAEAIRAMQEVMDHEEWMFMGGYGPPQAGHALLAALKGVPERIVALEELAARALVFSESFRYLSDNYTHCNCPRFDEDAQDSVDEALVALAALEEIDGD